MVKLTVSRASWRVARGKATQLPTQGHGRTAGGPPMAEEHVRLTTVGLPWWLTVRETHRQRAPPPLARGQSESRFSHRQLSPPSHSLPPPLWPVSGVSSPAVVAAKAAWATGRVWRRGGRMNGHGFSTIARRQFQLLPVDGSAAVDCICKFAIACSFQLPTTERSY